MHTHAHTHYTYTHMQARMRAQKASPLGGTCHTQLYLPPVLQHLCSPRGCAASTRRPICTMRRQTRWPGQFKQL